MPRIGKYSWEITKDIERVWEHYLIHVDVDSK